jgi:hypothetical protein
VYIFNLVVHFKSFHQIRTNGFTLAQWFLPWFKRSLPGSNGYLVQMIITLVQMAFYPGSYGFTFVQMVLPWFKWFYPLSNVLTLVQIVLPWFKWFYPSSNGLYFGP